MRNFTDSVILQFDDATDGNAGVAKTVTVRDTDTLSLANIFSDDGITPLINPFLTDTLGKYSFFVGDGLYTIIIDEGGAEQAFIPSQQIYDIANLPVGVESWNTRVGDVLPLDADYSGAQVTYDASASGLAATRVQAAIDEVDANVDAIEASYVVSFAGYDTPARNGAVVAATGDYDAPQIDYTSAFSTITATSVQGGLDGSFLLIAALAGGVRLRGVWDADTNLPNGTPDIDNDPRSSGDYWIVDNTGAGTGLAELPDTSGGTLTNWIDNESAIWLDIEVVTGLRATGTPTVNLVLDNNTVTAVVVDVAGTGYTVAPAVLFSNGNTRAEGTAVLSGGGVLSVTIDNAGLYLDAQLPITMVFGESDEKTPVVGWAKVPAAENLADTNVLVTNGTWPANLPQPAPATLFEEFGKTWPILSNAEAGRIGQLSGAPEVDMNLAQENRFIYIDGTSTLNAPAGIAGAGSALSVMTNNTLYSAQIAFGADGRSYIRAQGNGTWTAWEEIATESSIAGAYLKLIGGVLTGNLSLRAASSGLDAVRQIIFERLDGLSLGTVGINSGTNNKMLISSAYDGIIIDPSIYGTEIKAGTSVDITAPNINATASTDITLAASGAVVLSANNGNVDISSSFGAINLNAATVNVSSKLKIEGIAPTITVNPELPLIFQAGYADGSLQSYRFTNINGDQVADISGLGDATFNADVTAFNGLANEVTLSSRVGDEGASPVSALIPAGDSGFTAAAFGMGLADGYPFTSNWWAGLKFADGSGSGSPWLFSNRIDLYYGLNFDDGTPQTVPKKLAFASEIPQAGYAGLLANTSLTITLANPFAGIDDYSVAVSCNLGGNFSDASGAYVTRISGSQFTLANNTGSTSNIDWIVTARTQAT